MSPTSTDDRPADAADRPAGDDADGEEFAVERGPDGREVTVPMWLYKRVTVVSTLFAVAGVVAGFVLLDAATNRARAPPGEIDVGLAVLGLGCIGLAAGVYAYATRFRAPGTGPGGDDGR